MFNNWTLCKFKNLNILKFWEFEHFDDVQRYGHVRTLSKPSKWGTLHFIFYTLLLDALSWEFRVIMSFPFNNHGFEIFLLIYLNNYYSVCIYIKFLRFALIIGEFTPKTRQASFNSQPYIVSCGFIIFDIVLRVYRQ